jgi:peptide subunit release factor 1 (eRF1)
MNVFKCSCCHKKFNMKFVRKKSIMCINCGAPAYLLDATLDYDEFKEHIKKYGIRENEKVL